MAPNRATQLATSHLKIPIRRKNTNYAGLGSGPPICRDICSAPTDDWPGTGRLDQRLQWPLNLLVSGCMHQASLCENSFG